MRIRRPARPTTATATAAAAALALLAACGQESAADRLCDARADLRDSIATVTDEVAQADFGQARNGLEDVRRSYDRVRDAVTDLDPDRRRALRDDAEALAADVAAIEDAPSLDGVRSQLDVVSVEVQAFVGRASETVRCD